MDTTEDLAATEPQDQDRDRTRLGPEDAIVNAPAAAAVEPAPFDSVARADGDDPDSVFPAR